MSKQDQWHFEMAWTYLQHVQKLTPEAAKRIKDFVAEAEKRGDSPDTERTGGG